MDIFHELRKMAVLVVDDDEWVRDSLSLFFESEGCAIVALETAEQGLLALEDRAYDVIIADYRLPGMDGIEFLTQVNQRNPDCKPIKILVTAYGNELALREIRQLGINDFIPKPFSTATLLASLCKQIEKSGKAGPSAQSNDGKS
jgi:CheY-like chemotaxis protein